MFFHSFRAAAAAAACLAATADPALGAGTPTLDSSTSPAPTASPAVAAVTDPCTTLLAVVSRPTVSNAACNVKRGDTFLETGYTNTVTTGNGANVLSAYPNAELRTGIIGSALELDFFAPSSQRQPVGGAMRTGLSDAGFGFKTELGYTSKAVYGASADIIVPTGDPGFTAGFAQYQYGFNYSYALSPAVGLGATLQYDQLAGSNAAGVSQQYGTLIPSLVATLALPTNTQFFAEVAHYLKAGPNLPPRTFFDAGLQHDVGSAVQLDIEYGTNFNAVAGAKSHYVGGGVAVRTGP